MAERVNTNIGHRLSVLANDHVVLGIDFASSVENWKRELLLSTIEKCHGNQLAAAELMGIHRNTVNRLLRTLGITVPHRRQRRKRQPRRNVITFSHDRP